MNKYFQFPLGTHPALLALLVKCVAATVINLFQKFPNTLGTLILLHNGSGGGILTEESSTAKAGREQGKRLWKIQKQGRRIQMGKKTNESKTELPKPR